MCHSPQACYSSVKYPPLMADTIGSNRFEVVSNFKNSIKKKELEKRCSNNCLKIALQKNTKSFFKNKKNKQFLPFQQSKTNNNNSVKI